MTKYFSMGLKVGSLFISMLASYGLANADEHEQSFIDGKPAKQFVWAAGIVHDVSGRPVEGADVFLRFNWGGAVRMYETINSAKTDKAGHWEILGWDHLLIEGGIIIAHKAGYLYTSAPLRDPLAHFGIEKTKKSELESYDLVLPAHGGNLEVAVCRDGKELKHAKISLTRSGGDRLSGARYSGHDNGSNGILIANFLSPTATTDALGIAKFADLVPGDYRIVASAAGREPPDGIERVDPFGGPIEDCAIAEGVAASQGETKRFETNILQRGCNLPIRVLRPDGRPLALGEIWPCNASPVEFNVPRSWPGKDDGSTLYSFPQPGLLPIQFMPRQSDESKHIVSSDNFDDSYSTVIGLSALLTKRPMLTITVPPRGPTTLVVRVLDRDGKPLQASVAVDKSDKWNLVNAKRTNNDGYARFERRAAGDHQIDAFIDAKSPLDQKGDPAGLMALPSQEVTTHVGTTTNVTIRAQPAGMIQVRLRLSAGQKVEDYQLACDGLNEMSNESTKFRDGREIVIGPVREGKTTVSLFSAVESQSQSPLLMETVDVARDRTVSVDLVPPVTPKVKPPANDPQIAVVGMAGVRILGTGLPGSVGHVFLSDGKTPAYAARLAFFVPDQTSPVGTGETDALGRISVSGTWYSGDEPSVVLLDSPKVPVMVAWLPGKTGATVKPIESEADAKNLKILLPPPLSVSGKVTVGGKGVQGFPCDFVVVARYEGQGKLDGLLSRTVTVQADGNFELAGLTPGTYRVQAAMDRIWLSQSVELKVSTTAAKVDPLTLDIGTPGLETVLKIVDRDGKPVPDVKATVRRPRGPLADMLWPRPFRSDGAGLVHIPPLEAGTHRVYVRGAKVATITVPALSKSNASEPIPVIVIE